jgi:hypothetical protein
MPTRHQLSRFPDHVKAIGMMSLETVDLELELAVLFSRMLFINPRVGEAIYMTPRGDQARLDMMRHAAEELFAIRKNENPHGRSAKRKRGTLSKIKSILARAKRCIDKRHRSMHDDWYISSETKEIKRIEVDGKSGRVGVPMPLAQLTDDIRALRALIDDVTALAKEFRENPPTLVSTRL